jgi:hypothetical protein
VRLLFNTLLIILSLVPGPAHASTVARSVYCRAAANPHARVLGRIPSGARVEVKRRIDTWALIQREPRACWIASRYLTGESTADANRASLQRISANGRSSHEHAARMSRPHRRALLGPVRRERFSGGTGRIRRTPNYSYGSSCPCSGRNICFGPRGGRYCITSGGNKRYGV